MKGAHDVAWLAEATKVLTAQTVRESGTTMKGEHDTAWLAPAFKVLTQTKEKPTEKRNKKRKST